MAHMIYREAFYNRDDNPAWHALGHNVGKNAYHDAKQALEVIGGAPPVVLRPLFTEDGVEVPYRAIMRLPYDGDPDPAVNGVVSEDYGFISHEEAVDIAYIVMRDRAGNRLPVETMGFLRGGFELFISYVLPTIEVAREEVRQFMLLHLPLTGTDAASVSRSGQRTVCANTLSFALSGASEMYKVVHDAGARMRLANWMRDMYVRFEDRSEAVQEAMDLLSRRRANADAVNDVLLTAYPNQARPNEEAPPDVVETRLHDWELELKRMERYRVEAERLFLGDMTGYRTDLQGSFWYLYNAVAELENYRRGGGGPNGERTVAASISFGDRRSTMERTFAHSLELANKN